MSSLSPLMVVAQVTYSEADTGAWVGLATVFLLAAILGVLIVKS